MSNRIARLTYNQGLDREMFISKYIDLPEKCPSGTKVLSSGVEYMSNRNFMKNFTANRIFRKTNE